MAMHLDPKKTVFLIDASAFLYRAYYGLRPLHTSTGEPVQAVYSFIRMIKKLIDTFSVEHIALVWDSKGPTIRHEFYTDYKATRQEPPSDLFAQKEHIIQFADLVGIKQIAKQGFEADDLMYSLCKDFASSNMNVTLVTSDKDMGQAFVLGDHVLLYDPFKDTITNAQQFEQATGFPARKLPFFYALLGDSSDNIPGVRGIGKKGALELVQQFDSLEAMYNNLNAIAKERTRKILEEHKDDAFLSEKLFLLHYINLGISIKDLHFTNNKWSQALPLFKQLEFKTLVQEVSQVKLPATTESLSTLKGYEFKAITTHKELQQLIALIHEKQLFALDTELTGLRALQDEVIGVSICVQKGTAYYIPFGHKAAEVQLSREYVFNELKPILLDPNIKKVMHHAKFDQLALLHYGLKVNGLIFDTLIAAQLVTQDWQRIGLKYLSEYYLQEQMLNFQEVVTARGYKNFSEVPLALATEYAAADAHQTFQLMPILQEQLQQQNMHSLYYDMELLLVKVLCDMEYAGIFADVATLAQLNIQVTHDLAQVHAKLIALIGDAYKNINLNSSRQLAELLFEHLKLPPQKKTTAKSGYSTDQEVLETLAQLHPVPALIMQYRELFKLQSTYIEPLPTYINPQTGRIHTTFSQTAVATGRLASSEPNLQNVPPSIRSAFKPKEGCVFLSADYSQIELRVLAYLSQDATLINAFMHNEDIHQRTAANLFDVTLEQVTSEQRQIGKRINFSILYGLTPFGLSKDLKIPFKDAKLYIEKYFAQYPGVLLWMEKVIEETKKNGYVTTHWGRHRYIPGIYEDNKTLYDLARRIAINTVAQGTAAEIMKKGMIDLEHALHNNNLSAKIILQIHDELLLEVPEDQLEKTRELVQKKLESVVDWQNIRLVVSTSAGDSWGSL